VPCVPCCAVLCMSCYAVCAWCDFSRSFTSWTVYQRRHACCTATSPLIPYAQGIDEALHVVPPATHLIPKPLRQLYLLILTPLPFCLPLTSSICHAADVHATVMSEDTCVGCVCVRACVRVFVCKQHKHNTVGNGILLERKAGSSQMQKAHCTAYEMLMTSYTPLQTFLCNASVHASWKDAASPSCESILSGAPFISTSLQWKGFSSHS